MLELGEAERAPPPPLLERMGEKAVFKRWREPVVERRGVKDWKRLVRAGEEGIFVVVVGWLVGRLVACRLVLGVVVARFQPNYFLFPELMLR